MVKDFNFSYLAGYEHHGIDVNLKDFNTHRIFTETKAILDAADCVQGEYLFIEGVGVKMEHRDYIDYYYAPYLRKVKDGEKYSPRYSFNGYTWELPEELRW